MGRARTKAIHTANLPKEKVSKLDTLVEDPKVKLHKAEKQRKHNVRWTPDEWEILAETVHAIRMISPAASIWDMMRLAQDKLCAEGKWPNGRIRILTSTAMCEPIFPYLKEIDARLQYELKELKDFKERMAGLEELPSKDEIVNGLTDEEIRDKILQRALSLAEPDDILGMFAMEDLFYMVDTSDLLGYSAKRMCEDMLNKEIKLTQTIIDQTARAAALKFGEINNVKVETRKRKVAIVGANPQQFNRFAEEVRKELELIPTDKHKLNEKPIPIVDHIICWSNSVSQAQQKIINVQAKKMSVIPTFVSGGQNTILKKLGEIAGR